MKTTGFLILVACSICAMLSSCLATDDVDGKNDMENEPTTIVLNIESQQESSTRASSDHHLRYIARLFLSSPSNLGKSPDMRQEILEGNNDGGGEVNQIVFNVSPGQYYTIQLFADYITDTDRNSSGLYNDKYYNTSNYAVSNSRVTMITNPGRNVADTKNFFNNDNYDCFYGWVSGVKKEQKEVITLNLQRAVAKVRVVDNSGVKDDNYSVAISRIGHTPSFDILENSVGADRLSFGENSGFSNIDIANVNAGNYAEGQETELFFFYTFVGSTAPYTYMRFRTTKSDGTSVLTDIPDFKVNIQRNHITTVKGVFLPTPPGEEEIPPGPSIDPDEAGALILDLSTSQDWEQPDVTPDWQ